MTSIDSKVFPEPSIDPGFQAVLIGGGENYGLHRDSNTPDLLLDSGLELTGLQKPNVLIIPSARWKSEEGVNAATQSFADYYTNKGLKTEILHPHLYEPQVGDNRLVALDLEMSPSRVPSFGELTEKIEAADLTFVLGGDSHRMLNMVWKPLGIGALLAEAIRRGAVMSGTSAGTLAWFDGGHSDASSLQKDPLKAEKYHYVKGLGYIHGTVVGPHYDGAPANQVDRPRKASFHDMMYRRRRLGELGLGIDNNAAIRITTGGLVEVLKGRGDGNREVHAIHHRRGSQVNRTVTPADGQFELSELVA